MSNDLRYQVMVEVAAAWDRASSIDDVTDAIMGLIASPAAQQERKPLSSQRAREIAEAYYDPAMDEGDLVELVRCVEDAHRIGSPEGERTCD